MVRLRVYRIAYDPGVGGHFDAIERRYHWMIRREIERQLTHEPMVETRNRKPLSRPSLLSPAWELRFGPGNEFRVFYRIYAEDRTVLVVAVGRKIRAKLYIGGKAVTL